MNQTIFTMLSEQVEEFNACWAAVQETDKAMHEITTAAKSRISANRAYTDDRIAELKKQLADNSRTVTLHNMARRELEKLEAVHDTATPAEIESFDAAVKEADQAITDFQKVSKELGAFLEAATKEIQNCKAETYCSHSKDAQLARNWIESAKKDFEALRK